jgi:uncharacterized protein YraI
MVLNHVMQKLVRALALIAPLVAASAAYADPM